MSDLHNKMMDVSIRRKKDEGHAQERYRVSSRQRLMRILQKKFKTSFIGALAQFEKRFGHLWGHGKQESECSPNELLAREAWEQCRTDVLNNGNHQLRAVEQELSQYDVTWQRYQATMTPPGEPQKRQTDAEQEDV